MKRRASCSALLVAAGNSCAYIVYSSRSRPLSAITTKILVDGKMSRMLRLTTLLLALCVTLTYGMPAVAAGSDLHLGTLAVPKTSTVPPINGTIDGSVWKPAATAQLGYDLRNHALADQQTTVYMMTDGAFLYVAVDAKQRIPVRATEHTNGVGLDTDDE